MLFYYKLAGIVANISLVTNLIILMGLLSLMDFTLTLPGFAGIILTVGMAVDANVIIYERIKEELIAGKCIWAHDGGDPGAAEPPAVYYYTWNRATLKFTRHTIAAPGEGIALGRQFSVTDLNGDGRPDLLAPSKHSFWVLFNHGYK